MNPKKIIGAVLLVGLVYFLFNVSKTYYYSQNFLESKETNLAAIVSNSLWSERLKDDLEEIDKASIALFTYANKLEVLKYSIKEKDVVVLQFPFKVLQAPITEKGKPLNLSGAFTDPLDFNHVKSFIPIERTYKSEFNTLIMKANEKAFSAQQNAYSLENSSFINLEADGNSIFYLENNRDKAMQATILPSDIGFTIKIYLFK